MRQRKMYKEEETQRGTVAGWDSKRQVGWVFGHVLGTGRMREVWVGRKLDDIEISF